jgi:hypothetical protein
MIRSVHRRSRATQSNNNFPFARPASQNAARELKKKMNEWIPVGGGFIEADIIRWKESVFEKCGRRGRSVRAGERIVVAEVLKGVDKDGWVHLLIRRCEIISETQGRAVRTMLPIGTKTKRKFKTIVRGKAERLLWSDESARAVLASKFLGN